jgi:hypothetical protein
VTTLLLAKAWEGRRAFPGHGHALDANSRANPKSHIVELSDADPPIGDQPRCRSTRTRQCSPRRRMTSETTSLVAPGCHTPSSGCSRCTYRISVSRVRIRGVAPMPHVSGFNGEAARKSRSTTRAKCSHLVAAQRVLSQFESDGVACARRVGDRKSRRCVRDLAESLMTEWVSRQHRRVDAQRSTRRWAHLAGTWRRHGWLRQGL